MQILSCSATLGTCCSDYGLVMIIDTTRNVLSIIQLVVPIMLIIWATIDLFKMVINPDDKKGIKKLINKFIIAIVVFMIPVLVNAMIGLMPSTYNLSACFKQAKDKAEVARQNSKYINPYNDEKTSSILPKPNDYQPGVKKTTESESITDSKYKGTETGNASESAIVEYAKKFVGKPYKHGGNWNGELPYKPTDCVGFVQGVYNHFGIKIPASVNQLRNTPSKYTVVTKQKLHPGDIVLYNGHWAMLTGNGTEIIHARNPKLGIGYGKDYRKSGKPLIDVIRVNQVSR